MEKDDKPAKIIACARAAHEANRAYCNSLGDFSQVCWEDAPEHQKVSSVAGVYGVLNGNTPEQSHVSWLNQKKLTGWKFGPVKDEAKKEHPCFVPYAELPAAQKRKDDIFVKTVREVATQLGLEVAPHTPPGWKAGVWRKLGQMAKRLMPNTERETLKPPPPDPFARKLIITAADGVREETDAEFRERIKEATDGQK